MEKGHMTADQADPRRLVVRLPNWVGDVVMAIPTLAELSRVGWDVVAVGRGWAAELLAGLNIPIANCPRGAVAARGVIRQSGAGRGLLLTNSFSSALAMRLAGVRAIGHRDDARGWLLDRAVYKPRNLHEVEVFWRLGGAACRRWPPACAWPEQPPPRIELPLPEDRREMAGLALARHEVPGPYTICCPSAIGTTRGRPKKWPGFPALSNRLRESGRQVVACPGPGEEENVRRALPGAAILEGLSLGVYAAVLAGAEQVIANDSGPMHLAAAVGAPVLGVFGVSDPARTRPWGGAYVGGADRWPSLDEVWRAAARLRGARAA